MVQKAEVPNRFIYVFLLVLLELVMALQSLRRKERLARRKISNHGIDLHFVSGIVIL